LSLRHPKKFPRLPIAHCASLWRIMWYVLNIWLANQKWITVNNRNFRQVIKFRVCMQHNNNVRNFESQPVDWQELLRHGHRKCNVYLHFGTNNKLLPLLAKMTDGKCTTLIRNSEDKSVWILATTESFLQPLFDVIARAFFDFFRRCTLNSDYNLSPTYPSVLYVPSDGTDAVWSPQRHFSCDDINSRMFSSLRWYFLVRSSEVKHEFLCLRTFTQVAGPAFFGLCFCSRNSLSLTHVFSSGHLNLG